MKGELKAGGLALVVKSTDAEDVGKCVTLVQMVRPGEEFTSPGGQYCRSPEHNHPRWLVSGDVIVTMRGEIQFHGWATFPPENLLPIDGDDYYLSSATGDGLTKLAEMVGYKPAELTA